LKQVEETLNKHLGGSTPLPFDGSGSSAPPRYLPARASEVSIRSGSGWKAFMKFRRSSDASSSAASSSQKLEDGQTRRIMNACVNDIIALWADRIVQSCLVDQGVVLQDQPGLFVSFPSSLCFSWFLFFFFLTISTVSLPTYTASRAKITNQLQVRESIMNF
jgi:guanine nucleotide-binding protein subunit alpha